MDLVRERILWAKATLARNHRADAPASCRVFVNLRDMCQAMCEPPSFQRVLTIAAAIAALGPEDRPEGLIFEDPTGHILPSQVGDFTAEVRRAMDDHGWRHGHLLIHMHHSCGT